MSEPVGHAWPEAKLDDVQRLRVMAAGLPGVAYAEGVINAPIDGVWGLAGDLINGTPQIELGVRSTELIQQQGDLMTVRAELVMGVSMMFDVELRFGWCVMQSRTSLIGMAAVVEEPGQSTRFAHFEGTHAWGRILRPLFRWNIEGDIKRIARLLGTDVET